MTETIKLFKWAHGQDANIKEPIESLQEKGWQYADIPTASNFNWLFNRIQKALEEHATVINFLGEVTLELRKTVDKALTQSYANKEALGCSDNLSEDICSGLREMEKNIRAYHPNFPSYSWPRKKIKPLTGNESDG